jgi:hypothetical protein
VSRADGFRLYLQVCWTFEQFGGSETVSSQTGAISSRTASDPLTVSVPAFSRVERGRLILERDSDGWPAEMVASAAEGKRGGFAWVE